MNIVLMASGFFYLGSLILLIVNVFRYYRVDNSSFSNISEAFESVFNSMAAVIASGAVLIISLIVRIYQLIQ